MIIREDLAIQNSKSSNPETNQPDGDANKPSKNLNSINENEEPPSKDNKQSNTTTPAEEKETNSTEKSNVVTTASNGEIQEDVKKTKSNQVMFAEAPTYEGENKKNKCLVKQESIPTDQYHPILQVSKTPKTNPDTQPLSNKDAPKSNILQEYQLSSVSSDSSDTLRNDYICSISRDNSINARILERAMSCESILDSSDSCELKTIIISIGDDSECPSGKDVSKNQYSNPNSKLICVNQDIPEISPRLTPDINVTSVLYNVDNYDVLAGSKTAGSGSHLNIDDDTLSPDVSVATVINQVIKNEPKSRTNSASSIKEAENQSKTDSEAAENVSSCKYGNDNELVVLDVIKAQSSKNKPTKESILSRVNSSSLTCSDNDDSTDDSARHIKELYQNSGMKFNVTSRKSKKL